MGDVLKSKESDDMLSNGVIIDLVKVRNTGKFSSSGLSIILWIETLLDMKCNASKTNLHVKSLFAKYNQLLRDSKHSPEKLADFLNSRFQLPTSCLEPVNTTDETSPGSTITTASSSTPCEENTSEMPEFELENLAFKKQDADANNQAPEPVDSATKKLIEKGLELKKYRLLVEDLEKGKKELASKHETVMEVLHEKNSSIHALNARVLQLENVIEKLNCELNCTKKSLEETECHLEKSKSECSSIRQSSYFKRLQRREKELEKDAVLLQQHKQKGCDTRINALKKQIKSLQTVICNLYFSIFSSA